jgi:Pro-Pro endopeptidase
MKVSLLLLTFILSGESWAQIYSWTPGATDHLRQCPQPLVTGKSAADFSDVMKLNRIELITPSAQAAHVEQFMAEFAKFPKPLIDEMHSRNVGIRILEGTGVANDTTFGNWTHTSDGRDWSTVPGSGGRVDSHSNVPTRIVINRMYGTTTAANLFLHEHAHTLDSLYGYHVLSSTKTWANLIHQTSGAREFINVICGEYCLKSDAEAFADLFAYYYACEETRRHMEEKVPVIADFFKNLNSVKSLVDAEVATKKKKRKPAKSRRATQGPAACAVHDGNSADLSRAAKEMLNIADQVPRE